MKKFFSCLLLSSFPSFALASPAIITSPINGEWGAGSKGWFHNSSPWEISMRAGTLGIGPEVMFHRKNSHWGVRLDFDTYNIGFNDVYHDNARFHTMYEGASVAGTLHSVYSGNAKLMNGSVYGDYYPWKKSAFRLTGGLIFNTNGLSADGVASATGVATETRDITLSKVIMGRTFSQTFSKTFSKDLSYPNAGNIKGKGRYNPVAPYLGIGFNTSIGGGFYINGDLGAMFEGSSKVHLSPTGFMTQFNGYEKTIQKAHDKISHYMNYGSPVYPVAMVGIGYRF